MNSSKSIWGILLKVSLFFILVLSFLQVKIKFGWDPVKECMSCDSCDVNSSSIPIDSIKMLDVMRININEPQQLWVQIEPANATQKKLTWTSSNPTVASVVDSTGVVTATGKGDSCVITATAIDGSGKSASITIIVNKRNIIKKPGGEIMVKVNEPYKVEVETSAQNDKSLKWISSNPDVARVDQNGVIIGRKAGECVITATYTDGSNVSDSLIVKVADDNHEILITSIILKDITIEEGTSIRLRPIISPVNATKTDLEWHSNSKGVMVNSKGVVTGKKSGANAEITARAKDGSGVYGTCKVIVSKSSISYVKDYNLGYAKYTGYMQDGRPVSNEANEYGSLTITAPNQIKASITVSRGDIIIVKRYNNNSRECMGLLNGKIVEFKF